METSTLFFISICFIFLWYQVSSLPCLLNLFASCFLTTFMIYMLIISKVFLPIEQLLMHFIYKGTKRSSSALLEEEFEDPPTPLCSFDDEITRKLRELTGHIVRDFILEWYNTISDEVHFVQEAFEIFEHVLTGIRARVSEVDPEILIRVVISRLIRHLTSYQHSLACAASINHCDVTRKEQTLVVTYEKLHGHLAMSNLPDTEADHTRALVVTVLKGLLPKDYHLTATSLYLVRELIARNVILPLVDMLSDPAWIYEMIVLVLKDDDDDADGVDKCNEDGTESSDSEETIVVDTNDLTIQHPDGIVEDFPLQIEDCDVATREKPRNMSVSYSTALNSDGLQLDVSYQAETNDVIVLRDATEHLSSGRISSKEVDATSVPCTISNEDTNKILDVKENKIGDLESSPATSTKSLPEDPLPLSFSAHSAHFGDSGDVFNDENEITSMSSNMNNSSQHMGGNVVSRTPFTLLNKQRSSVQNNRLFQHVRIPDAVTVREAFKGGGKYTLYNITYRAPPAPTKKTSRSSFLHRSNAKGRMKDSSSRDGGTPEDLVEFKVQRRFREFLTLQDRLNEKAIMRKLICDVRGPSRMFPMPVGNMDKDYIEKRRKFLEAYLRELCSFPLVADSVEVKEFLAYVTDPRIAYVRKPSDYIPRFDKMLKNAVQELIGTASDKLSDVFNKDSDDFYNDVTAVPPPPLFSSKSMPDLVTLPPNNSYTPDPPNIISHHPSTSHLTNPVKRLKSIVLGKAIDVSLFEDGLRDYSPFSGPRNANNLSWGKSWKSTEELITNRTSGLHRPIHRRRTRGDGCDDLHNLKHNDPYGENFVAGAVFCLVRKIWKIKLGANTIMFLSLARYIKTYVDIQIKSLTMKDKWLHYVKLLQDALWPNGVWKGEKDDKALTESELFKEAHRVLQDTFPDALRYVVGEERYNAGISDLLNSFRNPTINRHLAYHIIDVIMRFVFPDLQTISSGNTNISL